MAAHRRRDTLYPRTKRTLAHCPRPTGFSCVVLHDHREKLGCGDYVVDGVPNVGGAEYTAAFAQELGVPDAAIDAA